MGDNSISQVTAGKIGFITQVNQYYDAIKESLFPRSSAGVVVDGAGSLGDSTRRWLKGYFSSKQPFEINGEPNGGTPSGVMLPYTGSATVAPYGWLFANGDTIGDTGSGATHEGPEYETLFNLYKVITDYGNAGTEDFASGDTVLIPDMSNCFVRNLDPAGSRAIGEYEADHMLQHTHQMYGSSPVAGTPEKSWSYSETNNWDVWENGYSAGDGTETVPKNKTFPHIIKV